MLWIHQQCFLLSNVVRFTPFPACSPKLGRIRLADISLHTQQDLISLQGSHPQCASTPPPPLCFCLFFGENRLFMSRRPVAVCELKVMVWALGLDRIWLENIKPFVFFFTLTMKQW